MMAPAGEIRSDRTGAAIGPTATTPRTSLEDEAEIVTLAAAEADRLAPRLRYDAPVYGILGGTATYFIVVLFGNLSGTNPHAAYWPTIVVVALGTGLPYLFAWHRAREHSRRYVEAWRRLEAERATTTKIDALPAKPAR